MRKILLLIGSILLSLGLYAQSPDIKTVAGADINNINEAYKKLAGISMSVKYTLYREHNGTTPKETHTAFYCKDGDENMFLQLYGTTTIRTRNYLFVKDDSNDVVMINKPANKEIFSASQLNYANMLTVCSTIEKLDGSTANECGYRLGFKGVKGEIDKLEFYFDKTTFMVQKVVIYYNRELMEQGKNPDDKEYFKPRLEVKYQDIKIGAQADKSMFAISKYLIKNKKGWALQSSLSKYQLIDQTLEKVK